MTQSVKRRKNTKTEHELAKAAELVADEIADRVYGGNKNTKPQIKRSLTCKRCNFSLTEQVSKEIDDLTSITSRVTRSDVVKASIYAFSMLEIDEQIKIVNVVKNRDE